MIVLKDISKTLGTNPVLSHLSLNIDKGQIHFIIGKSGVGKSVLLKHIVGLLQPDSGEIWVDTVEITGLSERHLLEVRRKCALVLQNPALLDGLTLFENIALPIRSHGNPLSEKQIAKMVHEKMEWTQLDLKMQSRYPHELSFGTLKRASIARALALDPSYLLLDEPTTGADPSTIFAINEVVKDLCLKKGVTGVVVSHDIRSALGIADQICIMDRGSICAQGNKTSLAKMDNPLVQSFLQTSMSHFAESDRH